MASLSEDSFCFSPKRIKLDLSSQGVPIIRETELSCTESQHEAPPQDNDELLTPEAFNTTPGPTDECKLFSSEIHPISMNLGIEGDMKEDDFDLEDDDDDGSDTSPYMNTLVWLKMQVEEGASARNIFAQLTGNSIRLPEAINDLSIFKKISSFLDDIPRRMYLKAYKDISDVIYLLKTCKKIIILTGAGVSVSCGIPDFRSRNGVYARLAVDFPDLPNPQSMFDINYFLKDPRPFFKFAKEIYPGQFKPSPSHRFIKLLEKKGKLLRNYTQNIDTLERVAGIKNVVECHGSFSTATCTNCGHKVSCEHIREKVFQLEIPVCTACTSKGLPENECGVMKPDIVFFGEGLPDTFHDSVQRDKNECDLLIVIGSSLKVKPVALIPNMLPISVPQILINRESLSSMKFDVELLGNSDDIVDQLCHMLGEDWCEGRSRETPLTYLDHSSLPDKGNNEPDTLSFDFLYGSKCQDEGNEESVSINSVICQKIGQSVGVVEEIPRHASLDSSRDSGIGEGSNCSSTSSSLSSNIYSKEKSYQPIDGAYFKMRKRMYVFPGAEISS